tara:strand:- start:1399 stop:1731 length:333 start_codon:yes stop_codon:yes gene_type:complete
LTVLDDISEIVEKEFESWSKKELIRCAIRLLTLELFIRIQEKDDKARHIWLTSSDHPLLLKVFDETDHMALSNEIIQEVMVAYTEILGVDVSMLGGIVHEILHPDLEEEQ